MFILRSASIKDLDSLYELSSLMVFINLPRNRAKLESKLKQSERSFANAASADLSRDHYIFVLEDKETNKVIGVSMIHAKHGTEDEPHYYLQTDNEQRFCESIQTGFMHGTLKLGIETNGYTEIGGLVVHPDYRGNPEKLGKQISFARFLYIAQNLDRFTEDLHSELMPPFDEKGKSALWEAVGRPFMNMDYYEADLLSRSHKDFILSLFPTENIYQTLLPITARRAIGQVNDQTKPVKKMLESIGFKYTNQVDPFDGGPHFRCKTKEVKPVDKLFKGKLTFGEIPEATPEYLIALNHPEHQFFAFKTKALMDGDKLIISEYIELDHITQGIEAQAIPLNF